MVMKILSRLYLTKLLVCLVGFIHLTLLYIGISTTLGEANYFEKNEDLERDERREAIILYTGHFLLICSLFLSVYKNSVRFLLPWLIVMAVPFTYMSFMLVIGLKDMKWYLINKLGLNLLLTATCWLFWSILFRIYKTGEFKTVNLIDKTCSITSFATKWKT